MLKYEITARLDTKTIDLYIDKADIAGTPDGKLEFMGLNVANGTTVDETTRWRITFTSGDFNPITRDYLIKVIDGNGDPTYYAEVNMNQGVCVESNGTIFDIYIKIDEGGAQAINVGGFYRGGSEPASSSVQASINGTSFIPASKVGTGPDTYEAIFPGAGSIIPQVISNSCPAVAVFKSLMVTACSVTIDSVVVTAPIGAGNKTVTVNATGVGTIGALEYRLSKFGTPGFTTPWQASNVFTGLDSGSYSVEVRDSVNTLCGAIQFVTVNDDLNAVLDITDVSVGGGSDGAITVNVLNGSGNYSYNWLDGPTTPTRTNLVAGTYEVTITDNETTQQLVLSGVVNQPSVIPTDRDPYFEVPKTQSLQFVVESSPDYINTFQDLDNMLLRNQKFFGFQGIDYCQKKDQNDNFKIQFRSNLANHEVKIQDFDGTQELTFTPGVVVENLGQTQEFNIRLQNHGAGQTRVYFVGELLVPVPVAVGDGFEIFNSADGFNGTYTVQAVETDSVTFEQYLVINYNFILTGTFTAEGRFLNETINFDIFEFTVLLSTLPVGIYFLTIRAFNDDLSFDQTAESEPISIKGHHEATNLITFTNVDNAFDIDYQNNIIHQLRVESHLFQRLPSGDSETLRNTDGSLEILSAKPQRKLNLQFWNLPPYLYEVLFLAFKHDVVKVNGLEVKAEESLNEPEYRDRNLLANSSIIIEAAEWFGTYNGDDLGGIAVEGGFIIANNGFIKRT